MALPVIEGEPKITQQDPKILMEVTIKSPDEPTGKWFKGDKDIAEGKEYTFKVDKLDGGKFRLTGTIITFSKALAGMYKCTINNKAGSVNATFNLTAGDAPEFTDKPHIVQRDGGAVLVIKIRAKSVHDPTTSWNKEGKPLEKSDRIKEVVQKDEKKPGEYLYQLEITNPETGDQGKYTCLVKNKDGENSQSVNLNFD